MKKSEIVVGGLYWAKVNTCVVRCQVLAIRDRTDFGRNAGKVTDSNCELRDWHEQTSDAHITGHCDPMYRKCRYCADAHPHYIQRCPMNSTPCTSV